MLSCTPVHASRFPIVLLSVIVFMLLPPVEGVAGLTDPPDRQPGGDLLQSAIAKLPLGFRRNAGQWEEAIRYRATTAEASVAFLDDGLSFGFARERSFTRPERVRGLEPGEQEHLVWNLRFVGRSPNMVISVDGRRNSRSSYLLGSDRSRHQINVPEYSTLWYRGIYDGIDLRYYGHEGGLKYDYILRPGASVASIRLACEGVRRLAVTAAGKLEITTAWGTLLEDEPYAYQDIGGRRRRVPVRYTLLDDTTYGFAVTGPYDRRHELVIDPIILQWATYIGGGYNPNNGYLYDIALDPLGNICGTGNYTDGFTTTPGVYNSAKGGLIVFKLSPSGKDLIFSTSISAGTGTSIHVDGAGDIYVGGSTTVDYFPTTPGAFDRSFHHSRPYSSDCVLFKLSSDGTRLLFSTFLGGEGSEGIKKVGLAPDGGIWVAGTTRSSDFPWTTGPALSTGGGAFLMKFSSDASTLLYGEMVGGGFKDEVHDMMIDSRGNIVVVGSCPLGNLRPTVIGSFPQGQSFIRKVDPSGVTLLSSRFHDGLTNVAEGEGGTLVLAGGMKAPAHAPLPNVTTIGGEDLYVAVLSPDGASLLSWTYLAGGDTPTELVRAADGTFWFAGNAWHKSGLPTDSCALHPYRPGGEFDIFLCNLSADLTRLNYATYIGGEHRDYHPSIELVPGCGGGIYMSLTSHSRDIPTTPDAFQRTKRNEVEDEPVVLCLKPVIDVDFEATIDRCGGVYLRNRSRADCLGDDALRRAVWQWDFGDGTISNEAEPIHYYKVPGTYAVKLRGSMPCDSTIEAIQVVTVADHGVVARAEIGRNHTCAPGDTIAIPVTLRSLPSAADIRDIILMLRYDTAVMRPADIEAHAQDALAGTLLDGWTITAMREQPGLIWLALSAPAGAAALGSTGTLLRLPFETFIRPGDTTLNVDLPFDLLLGDPCLRAVCDTGMVTLDICGLKDRWIELFPDSFALKPNRPNPFGPVTGIDFSIGLDGQTRLDILDAAGALVTTLVDKHLEAGDHSVEWNTEAYPSGLYYYRLTSGSWSSTRQMLLVK